MYPLTFCSATSMFLHVGLLHGYAGDKSFGCASSGIARESKNDALPWATIRRGQQKQGDKWHRESHDFWGQQNCCRPWAVHQ